MAEGERVTPHRQLLDVATPEQQRKGKARLSRTWLQYNKLARSPLEAF